MASDSTRPVTGYPAPNPNGFNHQPPPTATAFPYAAPPPQNYPYYTNNNHQYPSSTYYNPQRATFLRRFFAIIIATVIITGTIIFIIWLVLRPKLPQFRVESFSVTAPFNLTSNRLTTSWDVALTVRNPNGKITLYYDDVQAAVFYRGHSLADTYLAPFVQGKKSESALKASFAAASTFVDGRDVDGMNEERGKGGGSVGFNVRIIADVRFKAGIWRARRRLLKVYCGNLVVSVVGNGSRSNGLSGGPRQCSVGM
ncbi:hypothetical protein LIER_04555 [Lithospermum erythrorhizon]|uniref:Late embryogenesis abundant protein LEA-2 subgroup domain-containing protein n=1 Tax=Lithospermum erythrorhizon TaxID=34254 RepID=A0AAV3P1V1_LITER